jgi:hypothetical protein
VIKPNWYYLAIMSGLMVFGVAAGTGLNTPARPQLFWIVAFLAGFSDKFFAAVIDIVIGRLATPGKETEPDRTSVTVEH